MPSVRSQLPKPRSADPSLLAAGPTMGCRPAPAVQTASALAAVLLLSATPAFGEAEGGASNVENTKIMNGGASTIVNQRGARKTITRGVQLDRADFVSWRGGGKSWSPLTHHLLTHSVERI